MQSPTGSQRQREQRIDARAVANDGPLVQLRLTVLELVEIEIAPGGENVGIAVLQDAHDQEGRFATYFALVFGKYRRLPDDMTIGLALVDICLPQRRHPIGQHSTRVRKDDTGFETVAVSG